MISLRRRVLGLAWEGSRVVVAQASVSNGCLAIERAREISLGGLTLEDPKALGAALRKALREAGFSARSAVVGIPARDLLALEVPSPPAGEADAIRAAIEKELEQRLAVELKDLVYSVGATGKTGERVFVVAAARRVVDGITAALAAAGLKLEAIAPSALAWLSACNATGTAAHVLRGADWSDIVALHDGDPVLLRAFRPTPGATAESEQARLVLELRRAMWSLRPSALEPPGSAQPPCVAWRFVTDLLPLAPPADSGSEPDGDLDLSEDAGRLVEGFQWPADIPHVERFGIAAALAGFGSRSVLPPWSLVGRPARTQAARGRRRRIVIGATAAALVLAVAGGWFDLRSREAEVAALEAQLAAIEPDVKDAEMFVDRVGFGLEWFDARPSFLASLYEATLAFPEEGGAWATSYSARDGLASVVACKGADTQAALALLDKLKKNPNLVDVKLLEMREAGGKSREVTFTVSFRRKERS